MSLSSVRFLQSVGLSPLKVRRVSMRCRNKVPSRFRCHMIKSNLVHMSVPTSALREAVVFQKRWSSVVAKHNCLSDASLIAQVREVAKVGKWERAINLLCTWCADKAPHAGPTPLDVYPDGQCTNIEWVCEATMEGLLYYGHRESAFSLWRNCSASFMFSPPPMLLAKFAAYMILVEGKTQEALDLFSVAKLALAVDEQKNRTAIDCINMWMSVFTALKINGGSTPPEKAHHLQGNVLELLKLCVDSTDDIPATRLGLALHATILYISSLDRAGLPQCCIQILSHNDNCNTFISVSSRAVVLVAAFLISAGSEGNISALLETALPFLLRYLFPLPLTYFDPGTNTSMEGLPAFQCLFGDVLMLSLEEEGQAPSCGCRKTAGSVFLRRILEHNLVCPFLCGVIRHDLNKTQAPLLVYVLRTPLETESSDTLCAIFGSCLFQCVEMVLMEQTTDKAKHGLMLSYISRVLGPPFSSTTQPGARGVEVVSRGEGFSTSVVFYTELLKSVVNTVPRRETKVWHSFVRSLTCALLKHYNDSSASIPLKLQLDLHARWWLPELLMHVDSVREQFLLLALQHSEFISFSEWDSVVCAILRVLHNSENSSISSNSDSSGTLLQSSHMPSGTNYGRGTEDIHASILFRGVRRSLVQRFVKWEWLLKGTWESVDGVIRDPNCSALENILRVWVRVLNSCRVFHRSDIARELLGILFLPASPFLRRYDTKRCSTDCLLKFLVCGENGNLEVMGESTVIQRRLVQELSHWLPILGGRLRDVLRLLKPDRRQVSHQLLLMQNFIDNLLVMMQKHHDLGGAGRQLVLDLLECYECLCDDVLFLAPQLLNPLVRILRKAGLSDRLSILMKNTFLRIAKHFPGAHPLKQAESGFISLHARYVENHNSRFKLKQNLSEAQPHDSTKLIPSLGQNYILTLVECGHIDEIKELLCGQAFSSVDVHDSFPLDMTYQNSDDTSLLFTVRRAFHLMPLAERKALQILLVLYLAWRGINHPSVNPFHEPAGAVVEPESIVQAVQSLALQEPHLFNRYSDIATQVAEGVLQINEARALVSKRRIKRKSAIKVVLRDGYGVAKRVTTLRDLNSAIDSGDWVTALHSVPRLLREPLHVARKALLACEATARGAAWEGVLGLFNHAVHTWHKDRLLSGNPAPCACIGVQECGRIMTLLASGGRWVEAVKVFVSMGSHADGYLFSQACYALRVGGRPELAVDLWAMWRAYVGDAVAPTSQMCSQFLCCGVTGGTDMARAACIMLKAAAYRERVSHQPDAHVGDVRPHSVEFKNTPGTAVPICFEAEEDVTIALLRDRWREGWQDALRLALTSGRPRIIHEVGRKSPYKHIIYKAIVEKAASDGRNLSAKERVAIAGHLNVAAALSALTVKDKCERIKSLLEDLLGNDQC
uniref:Uncharacterized protein n=1 Tax=Trypanosoma vivax (strain Y486) TaxID=1055687 RepID=G0TYL1_TRYVY|nr:conserved hypothetical protein [Trypanosoma vivax Y486]